MNSSEPRGRSHSRRRSSSRSRSRSRSRDEMLEKYFRSIKPKINYFRKLRDVVDDYNKDPVKFENTMRKVPVDENMFNDTRVHEKLNEGDIVYHNREFTIVVAAGHGVVHLGRISRHPRELERINPLGPENMNNSYKVIFNKTGGKSRKSKKSIKMRKSRKSIKARKSRKM